MEVTPDATSRVCDSGEPGVIKVLRGRIVWEQADSSSRLRDAVLLVTAAAWLAYTRFYFYLQPRHLTVDGGFMMWLFNKPDPGCGLTRTFAWMWRGDLLRSAIAYPLGPLIFAGVLALAIYAAVALAAKKKIGLRFPVVAWQWTFVVAGLALAANWAAKLIWLGM